MHIFSDISMICSFQFLDFNWKQTKNNTNRFYQVTEHRHLKYYVSLGGPDLLFVSNSRESQEILRRIEREATFTYQTLTLSEEHAANVLYINGTLVHRSLMEIPVSHQVNVLEKGRRKSAAKIWIFIDAFVFADYCGKNWYSTTKPRNVGIR